MTTTQTAAALPVLTSESAFIGTMQGNLVAECTTFGTNAFTAEARANELVRRANAFPGLVEALEDCATGLASMWVVVAPNGTKNETLEHARALLSSLKQS